MIQNGSNNEQNYIWMQTELTTKKKSDYSAAFQV